MKRFLTAFLATVLLFTMSTAAFALNTPTEFADIDGHWAQTYIIESAQNQLMVGVGSDSLGRAIFDPQGIVTRAQTAAIVTRAFDLNYDHIRFIKEPLVSDYYRDVDNRSWYADSLLMCAINNIFDSGSNFYPDKAITRVEMAQAIQRCFTAKGISVPMIMMMPVYDDNDLIGEENLNAVAFVTNTGIMKGADNLFRPQDSLTRAEMARIIIACRKVIELNTSEEDLPSENISPAITTQKIRELSDRMEVDLEYPQLSGMADQSLQSRLNSNWAADAEAFKKEVASTLDEYIASSQEYDFTPNPYSAYSRYQLCYQNDRLLSLYIDFYQYTGGAHGMTVRQPHNIDLQSGNTITLDKLFIPGFDYQTLINAAVQAEIDKNPEIYFEGPDMGFTGITADQPYYLEEDALVVYFGLYEIAPYAAGIREFRIPLASLTDKLAFSI